MRKSLIIFVTVLATVAAAACAQKSKERQLQMFKYPCGMSFAFYTPLPPQEQGNTENFIVHSFSKNNFTIDYICRRKVTSRDFDIFNNGMQKQSAAKVMIDGRECYKTNNELVYTTYSNYKTGVSCKNNGQLESVEISIPIWKDKPEQSIVQQKKELAEKILSTISFK